MVLYSYTAYLESKDVSVKGVSKDKIILLDIISVYIEHGYIVEVKREI